MDYDEYADEEIHGVVNSRLQSLMGARFENLQPIGKGSFGDVFRG